MLYGGTDDVDNPNPNIHRHGGRGVVAARLDSKSIANGSATDVKAKLPVLAGRHAGCTERRTAWRGVCQYDGKMSAVRFRRKTLLYARANANPCCGGRAVQVASARTPEGPFGPLELVTFRGLSENSATDANVYFGAVSTNPVDADSLLGLFPVNAAAKNFEPARRENASCVALALSCDGVRFSDLACVVASPPRPHGRTLDHPATGFVRRGGAVFAYVQHNVPGIVAGRRTRVVRYAASVEALEAFTADAKNDLGCVGA